MEMTNVIAKNANGNQNFLIPSSRYLFFHSLFAFSIRRNRNSAKESQKKKREALE